jgi:3-phenylpropionate/cinnamic acid dioxygenase small subunit
MFEPVDTAAAIRFLLDKQLIEQIYFRYCEIIDAKDFDRLIEVFTPDSIGDYRSANGILQDGTGALARRLHNGMGAESDCGATQHNVFNIRVEIDGDSAASRAHFYAVHEGVRHCAGQTYTCWGEYTDRWVRTALGWRIAHRLYRNFLTEGPVEVIRARHAPPLSP